MTFKPTTLKHRRHKNSKNWIFIQKIVVFFVEFLCSNFSKFSRFAKDIRKISYIHQSEEFPSKFQLKVDVITYVLVRNLRFSSKRWIFFFKSTIFPSFRDTFGALINPLLPEFELLQQTGFFERYPLFL